MRGDDEQEQRDRAATMTTHVDVAACISCTSSTPGAISDAPVSSARRTRREPRLAVRGRLLELAHRRMQRGGAPQQVEADPADVEPDVAVVRPVQRAPGRRRVGDEQRDDARGQQVERGLALAGVDREADGRGEQQDVAERVGDRDELARRASARRRAGTGAIRNDPRQQRQAERDDQRVDDAGAVATRGLRRRTSISRPAISAG